jgi:hypothetical protein
MGMTMIEKMLARAGTGARCTGPCRLVRSFP